MRLRLAFSALAISALCVPALARPWYSVIDLYQAAGSSSYIEGFGLNDKNEVTGVWYNPLGQEGTFLYSNGVMHHLGNPDGMTQSTGVGINASGTIVGNASAPGQNVPFLYRNGQMQILAPSGQAQAINDDGTVVGVTGTGNSQRGFLYKDGVTTLIDTFGGVYSAANDISNSGYVVGVSTTGTGEPRAFRYRDGILTDLMIPGVTSSARAVNDLGDVAGVYKPTAADDVYRAFVMSAGTTVEIGNLGGRFCTAVDLNNAGQVVGTSDLSWTPSIHGFLYEEGKTWDLNALFVGGTSSQFHIYEAQAINENGWILAFGQGPNGWGSMILKREAVPEPASVAALGLGALAMIRRRKRA